MTTKYQASEHRPPEARGLAARRNEPYGNPKIGRDDHKGPSIGASAAGMKHVAADEWEAHKQRMAVCHGRENDEEANVEANPTPSVDGGVCNNDTRGGQSRGQPPSQMSTVLFGPMKAIGQANFEANPPQVLTALFGLTAVFGSTAGGKTQGKTRQGVSAADFLPTTTTRGNF